MSADEFADCFSLVCVHNDCAAQESPKSTAIINGMAGGSKGKEIRAISEQRSLIQPLQQLYGYATDTVNTTALLFVDILLLLYHCGRP